MATKDLTHTIKIVDGLPAATVTADADGATIDTQGFSSVAFGIQVASADASADLTVSLEESDDAAAWTAVAADDQYGETVEVGNSEPDTVYQLGYRGVKRYVRLTVTVAGGQADLAALTVLGHPHLSPTY